MPELGLMPDEIWSEESFKQLSEEPLQAGNREGMRLLAKVNLAYFHIPFCFDLLLISNCCRHFWRTLLTPKDRMLCSRLEARWRDSRPGSTNSELNLSCPIE